jgi:hypothetical protein
MRGERRVRQRTTLVVAQAKAVGVTGVMGMAALHQVGHRTNTLVMSVSAAA